MTIGEFAKKSALRAYVYSQCITCRYFHDYDVRCMICDDENDMHEERKGEPMGCDLYKVTTGNVDVARYMPLDTALILVKALMAEYYNDPELDYTIKRERGSDRTSVGD